MKKRYSKNMKKFLLNYKGNKYRANTFIGIVWKYLFNKVD